MKNNIITLFFLLQSISLNAQETLQSITERGNTTTSDIHVNALNAKGATVKTDPGNDQTPGLAAYALQGRGQNGSVYQWNIYTAPVGGGHGVRPNAFEVWEYPESQSNGCCLPRLVIDKSRNAPQTPTAVVVDQNGGLALGGYGGANGNALAINGTVGIGTMIRKAINLQLREI